jgi:type I restriction-modification system DNA methylase subunit
MPLFQNSVVTKQLQSQDKTKLITQWNVFATHFHNPAIQDNIRSSKEEQYQGEFLIDLFVNVLGYTKNPTPEFNLTTEYKNVKDSKKADGAILINDKVKAVIELKGTNTTDLNKIEAQAFGYKNNQPDCIYVITANFEKLRFYIDNATEHLEFNLFNLTEKEFELLYLCLAYENIANDVPKKLKEQSLSKEKDITKELYTDYSEFKRELHQDLVKQNPDFHALELFKKSQKLLDRFLFLFFAEDRGLLPDNSVKKILNQWQQLKELDEYKPLYERYKKYFNYLNTGFKGKESDIFAYNGGLFKPDDILDGIKIDDELLFKYTLKLSEYDFASEVDVNILGHIFENSLNELDEIKAKLEGGIIDKQSTKRKKDGVFYTPKYITKYIVDNTVGKLCIDKKAEIKIVEEDYFTDKKRTKVTKQPLLEKLNNYRSWLLQITICDPACGSGAFLNQALDFLIQEHRYIDELQAKLFGDALVLSDVEKSILENNLYGVDLNEESVEIAKLSLWLRTAQPNRKLNDLNNNIKCGNSLIDDPTIAGEKAFNWQTAFPKVFEKGGFDVIIGNPPYVSNKEMHKNKLQNQIQHWNQKYEATKSGNYDLYILFVEQSMRILKQNQRLSFIIPNKFLSAKYSESLLKFISDNYFFEKIVDYSNINVFADASVYPIIISVIKKALNIKTVDRIIVDKGAFEDFSETRKWNYLDLKYQDKLNLEVDSIIRKIETSKDLVNSKLSFEPGINGFQFTNYSVCVTDGKINEKSKKLTVTGNIDPYIFLNNITRYKKVDYNEPFIRFEKDIISEGKWELFCKPKIMVAGMTKRIEASLDIYGNYAPSVSVYSICGEVEILKNVILLLNSKLINWFFLYKFSDKHLAGGYISINNLMLKKIPFKKLKINNNYAVLSNNLRIDLQEQSQKFQRNLQREFQLESLPKKLQDWYLLSYADFIAVLEKQKVKLSLSQKAEWEDYFTTEATKVNAIKTQIEATDKEIDAMVYELYGLSKEEIEIVEQS